MIIYINENSHTVSIGRVYYYNVRTKETTWNKVIVAIAISPIECH